MAGPVQDSLLHTSPGTPQTEPPVIIVERSPPMQEGTVGATQAPVPPDSAQQTQAPRQPGQLRQQELPQQQELPSQQAPRQQQPRQTQPALPVEQRPVEQRPAQPRVPAQPARQPPEKPQPVHKGTLVFVIDDAGNNLKELDPFLRFPGALTIAVLPGLPHSAEAARRIRAAGKEVFLHQPMEALGGQSPGPGAIYSGMGDEEIRALLRQNINEIGPIAGINNHQGSKITMDSRIMEVVLTFCREQGLPFLDSRTTADTQAPNVARQLGMKIGQRNIFIDNDSDRGSMTKYINDGLAFAQKNGSAVMIGHTWSSGLGPLLSDLYQGISEQGYTLSVASRFIISE